jgi:hypothetical protein
LKCIRHGLHSANHGHQGNKIPRIACACPQRTTPPTLRVDRLVQLWCAKRELRRRREMYPLLVEADQMPEKIARQELAEQRAIVATLQALRDAQSHEVGAYHDAGWGRR